ncbi:tellurium resistance protein TerC [Aestuariibacter sp. AA17]|uniref:Tellurium resistance protein TerC n=1 Tax=Fluctibacter corallii TaxID=2984329 RepID=A0ABT3A6A8_9ALTE|nr:PGPGW domain-containing protein [Aestuariibacter sp. AA17]MCV2883891.1 tellurium resistance protein TerC [Aestuariibacter sp. AA17]
MKKHARITLGTLCVLFGVILFILPGSMFVLLFGLFMLSFDVPIARVWLQRCQNMMSKSARRLDSTMLKWKYRRF